MNRIGQRTKALFVCYTITTPLGEIKIDHKFGFQVNRTFLNHEWVCLSIMAKKLFVVKITKGQHRKLLNWDLYSFFG